MKQNIPYRLPLWHRGFVMIICLFGTGHLKGQPSFYAIDQVQEIRIAMPQAGWRHQLDSLMKGGHTDVRLEGAVTINGERYTGCGIRFKGFSSWNEGQTKNPFNISIDYHISNRNHEGYTKLKLSNVIHDPSFLREVVSYQVAREYMPAPEAGFAMVYVNDTLMGLYSNVESVDKRFLEKHYGSPDRVLIKGNPDKLMFPFGQNANLAFISNQDSMAYESYYKLESDYGWQQLMEMIDVLHHQPKQLDEVLNVDRVLWMHAFNYALLNFDSYIGYAQNYYLASDHHGRLNPVLWDLNMSLGSFRNSDGAFLFQGLTIPQIIDADPLQHLTFSITPRPLMTLLFNDSTYRRMFLAHLRTIVSEQFESGALMALAAYIHGQIQPFVLADTNCFYSYQAFIDNLDATVSGNTPGTFYVGLRELVEKRAEYLRGYPGYNAHPVIMGHHSGDVQPAKGDDMQIKAVVVGAEEVWLYYRFSQYDLFTAIRMHDDGFHGDSLPEDGIWGVSLPVAGDIVQYYFYAQNDSAGIFLPEKAQTSYFSVYPKVSKGRLVINEINRTSLVAQQGDAVTASHWIELFNNSSDSISLRNLWLSNDSLNLRLWPLPETLIPPLSYFILFPDGTGVLPDRCNFSLSDPAGWIGIGYDHAPLLDEVAYAALEGKRTLGRYPNGIGEFVPMSASMAKRNLPPLSVPSRLFLYPNPAKEIVFFEGLGRGAYLCRLFSSDGRLNRVMEFEIPADREVPFSYALDLKNIPAGIYVMQIRNSEQVYAEKLVIYE
jgi:hypothetical protein